jgi:ABC-type Zn uptake system ZnuABC Zn-binding protein ZnuA
VSTESADEASKHLRGALSQDGFLKFLNSAAGVPKEVALKIFPDLAKLLGRGTEAFEKMHKATVEANAPSQESALQHENFVAQVYAEQLRLESLTPQERANLNEKLEEGAKRVFAKDSENKEFLQTLLKLAGAGVLGALALAVVVVGGKSAIENAKI